MTRKAANYWLCLVLLGVWAVSAPAANICFISAMDTATQASDAAIKTFMESMGHTVTFCDDDADQATTRAAALASDMVFVSESVGSSKVGNEIDDIARPFVVTEMYVWDEMGLMAAAGASPTFENTNIQIVKPGHPLAAGLQGTVSVLNSLTSTRGAARFANGKVGGGGVVIAQATAAGVTYDMYVVYDKGVALAKAPGDGSAAVAADIRIGLGLDELSYLVWNDNAYALLRASINYALGLSTLGTAADPIPAADSTDVARDEILQWTAGPWAAAHDVYLGTVFADVNSADRSNPKGVLVSQGQTGNAYAPAGLQYGKTYYWRVDEVNAPPSTKVFKGRVWSFTVEPYAYKITGVTATASSTDPTSNVQNAANGVGLNAGDGHVTSIAETWLSSRTATGAQWIQFAFGRTYKLHQMWIWNHNNEFESYVGFGIKDAKIEYSTNGTDWTTLGDYQFARAPGTPNYAHNTTIDLSGILASHVRITAKSTWGGNSQCGLSEVRFLYIPVWAHNPAPAAGAGDVSLNPTLSWRAGREAVSQQIYFGTDSAAVTNGTGSAIATAASSYTPSPLTLGTTYYWKVNEVNQAGTPGVWTGDVWNFTTSAFLLVDDMESYNDKEGTAVFNTWADGYNTSTNGALVGNAQPPYNETTIIHGGRQSMPFSYGNVATAAMSEATRTFGTGQDWTVSGIKTLVIYFRGVATNTAAQLYVKVNGTRIDYPGSTADLLATTWKQWNVDLTGVSNLKAVKTLTLGVTGSVTGLLYFDDIRLYKTAP
jgi:hypothetical protein